MFFKRFLVGVFSISIITGPVFAQSDSVPKQKKPNIVYFLVDNTGWGSFGVYGGTVATPNIDKLASQGIRFNNYNVEVQCTPSRSAIMTGRMPVRSGTYTVPWPGQGKAGMAP
jgi:arylsulfatase A-like enzyme